MREEPLGKFLGKRLDLQQFYLLQITSTNRSISIVYLRAQLGIATLQMLASFLLFSIILKPFSLLVIVSGP